jgi:hypothetical protein
MGGMQLAVRMRRVLFLVTVTIVLVTLLAWFHLTRTTPPTHPSDFVVDRRRLEVALIETGGSHDEVTAALYYALGSIPAIHTSMYLAHPRFRIEDVYEWLRHDKLSSYSISPLSMLHSNNNDTNPPLPDAVILASCELDASKVLVDTLLQSYFDHGSQQQPVICVIHHVDRFRNIEERLRRWARTSRLHLLTLSTHTTESLHKELARDQYDGLYSHTKVDTFPPVFPVPLNHTTPYSDRLSIVVQGNLEAGRRNYRKTLLDFEHMLDELPPAVVSRLELILAGTGKQIDIPERILPHVSANISLDYVPYYNLLHRCFALLTAFANEDYFKNKASSSVPASLIANVPLMASRKLVDAYGYLTQASVWSEEENGESEMTGVFELLRQHFDDQGHERQSWGLALEEKREAGRKRALELTEGNGRLMRAMVEKDSFQ